VKGEGIERIVKFIVSIDRDENGVWVAECPSIDHALA